MIQDERIQFLNNRQVADGSIVVYWMQSSQRAEFNHALQYATRTANDLHKPLVVFFGLTPDYPEANFRHYAFMLQGLKETQSNLADRGIAFVIQKKSPERGIVTFAKDACLVITDRGYTKVQKAWREHAAAHLDCPLVQVESDVVVPVEVADSKPAFAAADFRRKMTKHLDDFLIPLTDEPPKLKSIGREEHSIDLSDLNAVLDNLDVDRSVSPVDAFIGGASNAERLLDIFIAEKLDKYAELRNDASVDYQSGLSPYLHFGQISPLYVALKVRDIGGENVEAFLDELIVRRELAINFTHYNEHYDSYDGVPDWARETLQEHKQDTRACRFTLEELEQGLTYDRYWNAAQKQLLCTGKMHGYMRMYWGKQLIEWFASPKEAFETALYLNDKYHIDGRDPNSYTGIAWCFGKHDHPWPQRPVFGKVRSMSPDGLKHKFDVSAYIRRVEAQCSLDT